MIYNEREYRITRAQADKFEHALRELEGSDGDSVLIDLHKSAISSQIEELHSELREYEELKSGATQEIIIDSFEEIPIALIRARIASGMSQKKLAERLGLKEQQIQRYEASRYASASLARLLEVIDVLGLQIKESWYLPQSVTTIKGFLARLNALNIDRTFLFKRVLPAELAEELRKSDGAELTSTLLLRAASYVAMVLSVEAQSLLGPFAPQLSAEVTGLARFKLPVNASQRRLTAYCLYAHYLANLTLKATPVAKTSAIPSDATLCRKEIMRWHGKVTFVAILKYAWEIGVPVLPLSDSGQFHGACWRIGGRNVIVLKQNSRSMARWAFDLLHELYHAGQEPDEYERAILEVEEISSSWRDSEEEQDASAFAGDVLLAGRAEELVQQCIRAAGGSVERLKKAVPNVAATADVDVGALANYMAFRLSLQDINWWGTANNLQEDGDEPQQVARNILFENVRLNRLDDMNRGMLVRAVSD